MGEHRCHPPGVAHVWTNRSHAFPPFAVPFHIVNGADWHVEGGFYEKYATINHVIAPECGAYKKNKKTATVSAHTIKYYVH